MKKRGRFRPLSVSALSVGATESDQAELERIFQGIGWKLGRVSTRNEAHAFMDSTPVRVVISERNLPAGGWREMLEDLMQRPEPPALVVTARLADESLWAEVLNMGGFDVLAKPFDREEVTRVISAAMRRFENERQRRLPASSRPLVMAAAS